MSNIFENIKPFEFIAEANKKKYTTAPPTNRLNFIYVALKRNIFDELETEMKKLDAVEVAKFPENNGENKYVVMFDNASDKDAATEWASKKESEGALSKIDAGDAGYKALYDYYGERVKRDYKEISGWMASNPEPDARAANAMKGKISSFVRILRMVDEAKLSTPDVERRKKWRTMSNTYRQRVKSYDEVLRNAGKAQLNNVRRLVDSIDYENRELAIKKLSDAMVAIKTMKSHGEIDPVSEGALMKQIEAARKKLGITADKFDSVLKSGAGETLASFVMSFIYTEQKDAQQIADEYSAVISAIEAQKDTLEPDTYKNLKQIMENEMTTKVAILKAIEEREKMPVNTQDEEAADKPAQDVEIVASNAEGNVYDIRVQLALGQSVTVSNLEQMKGEGKAKAGAVSKKEQDREILKGALLARTEVSMFNLMGYEPKGAAAYVVDSYDPLRKHVGEVLQVVSRDTAGLLLSVFGKNGRELGEGFGRVLKHELIGHPLDVNPALAQGEMWLRDKFNMFPNKEEGDIRKAANRIHEDASAGVASAGTAPGGDGMNVPGMIGGMGDPVAPTKDADGSGDVFTPHSKKKKKKNSDASVLDFYSFRDSIYVNK